MKKFQVAIIVSVKASTYEEALAEVSDEIEMGGLSVCDYDKVEVIHHFDEDNDGQRILYLDAIQDAESEDDEENDEAAE